MSRSGKDSIFEARGYRRRWRERAAVRRVEEYTGEGSDGPRSSAGTAETLSSVVDGAPLGPEEFQQYWDELPEALQEMVSEQGVVSVDLLTYIALGPEDRRSLLSSCGVAEARLPMTEIFLHVLQLDAELRVQRLQRGRVARRGPEATLAMASAAKQARRLVEVTELQPGELPSETWLEMRSGAVKLVRRKAGRIYGLDEGVVTQQAIDAARWEKEVKAFVEEMERHPKLPLIVKARGSVDPAGFVKRRWGP